MDLVPGQHVKWIRVAEKNPSGDRNAPKWQPTPEQVRSGIQYLLKELPPDTEDLEQQIFLITARTNPSPIYNWPEKVIEKAVHRIESSRGGADCEYFFPLLSFDLKDVLRKEVLPMMLPYSKEFGVLCGGWTGVGKTQFMKVFAMMMGRFWIQEKDLVNRKACWRRGKKIERFKSKAQEICEMLMLDDARKGAVDIDDLMAFLELAEAGSGDGRYTDTKYCFNGPRSYITNHVDLSKEPPLGETVRPTDFWFMVGEICGKQPDVLVLALFKRCISLIAGKKRVYLRLPSEDPEEKIYAFTANDVAKDWLKPDNKDYLEKFRQGEHVKMPDYDRLVAEEMEWVRTCIAAPKVPLTKFVEPTPVVNLPPSPPKFGAQAPMGIPFDSSGSYHFPKAPVIRGTSNIRSRFNIPGDAPGSSSRGRARKEAPAGCVDVKIEQPDELSDYELAKVLQAAEDLAKADPIVIEESPPKRPRSSLDDSQAEAELPEDDELDADIDLEAELSQMIGDAVNVD
jgi:hypothetical protein